MFQLSPYFVVKEPPFGSSESKQKALDKYVFANLMSNSAENKPAITFLSKGAIPSPLNRMINPNVFQ
ncbi:hypothetical protein WN943_014958 [Citrus x changshan-huyou]